MPQRQQAVLGDFLGNEAKTTNFKIKRHCKKVSVKIGNIFRVH